MKCTTKILIGILLSGMVVVVVGAMILSTFKGRREDLRFDGKHAQMNVAPFRVVNVLVEAGERLKKEDITIQGSLSILPSTGGPNVLSYPENLEHYLSVVATNDTLNLILKISEYSLPDKLRNKEKIFLELPIMLLTADSSLVAGCSEASNLNINVSNLKVDSISLKAAWLKVDSCHFGSLSVNSTRRINLKNSQIHDLYLDLDNIRHWDVINCRIENEYLTGGGRHHNDLQRGECRNMYWKPKNKEAELRVTLNEEASLSLPN